ncbi:MAG TPA: sodium-dependent transporter [Halococcus sp.]|nr:sodium-dependent transporter [Halococcus sp.]
MSSDEARTAREEWGTRFGFLMAMVGAMVGSGNIWRMPYITGKYGGGAFLVVYLFLLFVIAVPGLMAETMLGRYTGKGVIGTFRDVLGSGRSEGFGLVVLIVNIALMSYYAPIIGWTLYYMINSFLLTFFQSGFAALAFWESFIGSPVLTIGMHTITMLLIGGALFFGISRGIERVVKWMIPALVVALIAVAIRAVTLPGAIAGLEFLFTPDWEYVFRADTWTAALGQVLFSTGLGWGIALTFGSYLRKHDDVALGGLFTAVGNTSVGLIAIFAIFPAVFAFGIEPTTGSELTFITLVQVFPRMPAGPVWAILFFVAFFFATYSSGLGITEVSVTTVNEETRLSRRQTVAAITFVIWLLGLPSAYSQSFLNTMDFMFGSWGLPLATLCIIGLVGWKLRPERFRVLELNRNSDIHVGQWWNPIIKYVIPFVMIFIMGFFVVTGLETPIQTIGGLVLVAVILVVSIFIMGLLRRSRPAEGVPGGDD